MTGETIISIAYGLNVLPKDDPHISTSEKALRPISAAAVPGTFLVDTLPWLKYVPEWLPYAGFKRKAREWRQMVMAMRDKPFAEGKQKFVSTTMLYQSTHLHRYFHLTGAR